MSNERTRRVSPSMIVAIIALVFAVSGSAIGAALISGSSLRNKSVGGEKLKPATLIGAHIKNFSLPATKLRDDSVTGKQVNESTLVNLHPGTLVTRRMALGEQLEVFRNGPIAIVARCHNNGTEDLVELLAVTSLPGSVMEGNTDLPGAPGATLEPATPDAERIFLQNFAPTGETNVDIDADEGFILAPDGSRISVNGDTATLGLNYLGAKCVFGFYAIADRI